MTQIKTGMSIDEKVLIAAKVAVETGKYRNISHFFEYAGRELLRREKISEGCQQATSA